jgi:predicted DNA-binding protein (MmcQ/YjbR family)
VDAEQARTILRKLPHAEETMQWGANLVYWVGDKAIGGKMFALVNLDEDKDPNNPTPVLSFYAGPERSGELLETEGVVPAPYMAHIYWVALKHWNVFRLAELKALLQAAYAGVEARLPRRVREMLAMPAATRDKLIGERRKLLASREAAVAEAKAAKKAAAKKKIAATKSTKSKSK